MNQHIQTLLNFIEQSEKLSADEKNNFSSAAKNVEKELDSKNRDLEFETSLEKVRAVALSMKKAEELTGICEVLFIELRSLGFIEMRNTMINIHNDEKESFLNYDYSDEIGKSITHFFYNTHPVIEKQIKQIRSSNDAFSVTAFNGSELDEWNKFRKSRGEKDDPRLENISELYYYFYSIGTGSIGISSFSSLTEEKLDMLKRFRNVFDLAYRRYIDIEQAEAQAREAQIELSLERVRARTMAMQKSDELPETSHILFEQMKELGEPVEQLTIGIVQEENNVIEISATLHGDTLKKIYLHSIDEPYMMTKVYKAWKTQQKKLIVELKGDELNSYNKYRNELTNSEMFPTNLGDEHRRIVYAAFFSKGMLALGANEPRPPQSLQLLERFASVFDLTYTRFLDLQKAEAQAREAQIELSLERVRARTMAMQKSDELQDVAILLFQQMNVLGVQTGSCGFNIWNKDEKTATVWMTSSEGGLQAPFIMPHTESEIYKNVYSDMKNGETFLVKEVGGKALKKHFDYLLSLPGIGDVIKKLREKGYTFPEIIVYHFAFFNNGYLSFHLSKPYPEAHDIFKRLAKVFEQTYTRFLDLQKAEAQAREAKIEASLERVRSRSLAMHSSDELVDASTVLFNELKSLNIETIRTGIGIVDELNESVEVWSSQLINQKQNNILGTVPFNIHPFFKGYFESWKRKESYFTYEMVDEELKEYYKKVSPLLSYPEKIEFNSKESFYIFFFPEGSLNVISLNKLSDDECSLMIRFARVFGLIYRRFLDLKQAEAQTREAKIEAALEKVRGRAMAMHNSNDLSSTASIVFSELRKLGIQPIRSGVGLLTKDFHKVLLYAATASLESDALALVGQIDMSGNPCLKMQYESCLKKENYFPVLSGEELKSYYKELAIQISVPTLTEEQFRHEHYGYYFPFSEGYFYAWSEKSFSENEINILNRFKVIVDLTFRRYLDLQKAEAQAHESQIELALERVRARTMAMQRSDELGETAYLLFQQFCDLGESPEQITIGIINELENVIDLSMTMHGNKMNEVIKASIDEPIVVNKIYVAWKEKKKTLILDISGKDLSDYNNFRNSLRTNSVKDTNKENRRVINIAFFSKGIISISTPEPRPNETIRLLERFAGVFDLTYTRFLDLKNAEAQAREARIETALERVRSRTMAMHKSDELAETAAILFKQLSDLGIAPNRLYIFIIKDETGDFEAWITEEDGKEVSQRFKANIRQSLVFSKMYDGWKSQKKSITIDLQGKDLADYIQLLSEEMHAPVTIGHSQKRRVQSIAYFSNGCIGIASPEPQPDKSINLLERFAGVFNLTYTRFNDLQNAEAQTYKANIEVALERVRARALAMQQPEELVEVAQVMRHEMGLMGIEELEISSIFIHDDGSDKAETWYAIKEGSGSEKRLVSGNFIINLDETWVGRQMIEFYNSTNQQISIPMVGANRKEWFYYCSRQSKVLEGFYDDTIPDRIYHLLKFSNGAIGAATAGEISEESRDLLKRAASVFSLAYSRFKDLSKARLDLQELKEEKKKSDALLLNILPAEVADELKMFGKSYARKHEQVTILFADIKGFSSIAENLSAEELVAQLDECFRAFDNIVEKHGLEKIKTIGDAYVAACGLPKPVPDNASKTVLAALDMIEFIKGFGMTKKIQNLPAFEFRVGIHTGPVITGVVGLKKFTYDIWGDAVNMAARMEQHGEAGKINISGFTYQLVKDKFTCIHRGKIEAKNKGEVDMYFVEKSL